MRWLSRFSGSANGQPLESTQSALAPLLMHSVSATGS